MNFVDTAELYGGGKSERIVGEAIRDVRDEVVVTTKVSLNWVLRSPAVVAIPGAKREEHVRQNVGAVCWSLTQDELEAVEAALSS